MTGDIQNIQQLFITKYAPLLEKGVDQAITYSKDLFRRAVQYYSMINGIGAICATILAIVGATLMIRSFIRGSNDIKAAKEVSRYRSDWQWGATAGIMCFIGAFLIVISLVMGIVSVGAFIQLQTIPEVFIYKAITN